MGRNRWAHNSETSGEFGTNYALAVLSEVFSNSENQTIGDL